MFYIFLKKNPKISILLASSLFFFEGLLASHNWLLLVEPRAMHQLIPVCKHNYKHMALEFSSPRRSSRRRWLGVELLNDHLMSVGTESLARE